MNQNIKYFFSDAWLFLSIILSTHNKKKVYAELTSIIASADFINHAIISFEEVRDGLNKLLKAKLIKEDNKRFCLAERGKEIYLKINKKSNSHLDVVGAIDKFFNQKLLLDSNNSLKKKKNITKEDYELALKNYIKN